jgi:hypothetical protein
MNHPILEFTYFKYIPYDIREYIWNINYSWAINIIIYNIQKYIQYQKKIKIDFMHDTISNVYHDLGNDLGIYNKHYHIYCSGKLYSKKDVFDLVSTCKCCSRHQKNRPNKLDVYFDTEMNLEEKNYSCGCICPCRHLSRFICRSVNTENNNINNN